MVFPYQTLDYFQDISRTNLIFFKDVITSSFNLIMTRALRIIRSKKASNLKHIEACILDF